MPPTERRMILCIDLENTGNKTVVTFSVKVIRGHSLGVIEDNFDNLNLESHCSEIRIGLPPSFLLRLLSSSQRRVLRI
jgi:hypothetical protein